MSFRLFKRGAILSLLALPFLAHAHPHVFMDDKVTVVCDDQGVQAIQVSLLYDEMYSQTRWEAFDINQNGIFEADEFAQMVKNEREIFDHDGPFVWLKLDGQKIKTESPRDFSVKTEGKQLRVTYTIPCRIEIKKEGTELRIGIYDAEFFYQLTYEDNPISVSGNTRFQITCELAENPDETYYYGITRPGDSPLRRGWHGQDHPDEGNDLHY